MRQPKANMKQFASSDPPSADRFQTALSGAHGRRQAMGDVESGGHTAHPRGHRRKITVSTANRLRIGQGGVLRCGAAEKGGSRGVQKRGKRGGGGKLLYTKWKVIFHFDDSSVPKNANSLGKSSWHTGCIGSWRYATNQQRFSSPDRASGQRQPPWENVSARRNFSQLVARPSLLANFPLFFAESGHPLANHCMPTSEHTQRHGRQNPQREPGQ